MLIIALFGLIVAISPWWMIIVAAVAAGTISEVIAVNNAWDFMNYRFGDGLLGRVVMGLLIFAAIWAATIPLRRRLAKRHAEQGGMSPWNRDRK